MNKLREMGYGVEFEDIEHLEHRVYDEQFGNSI